MNFFQRSVRFNQYERDQWVRRQAAQIPAGSKVLDIGAGTGPYRQCFSHCDYRAHDFAQEPGTLGKYTPLDYQSDILSIPVADNSFQVILCTEVLEHVPEPIKALREFGRILVPQGRLLLSAPLGSFLHQEPYHFYGGFTPHWYAKFLPEAGFRIENITANRGFFSLFGQEALRFSSLINPRRTRGYGLVVWLGLSVIWLLTLPLMRFLFPFLGELLDRQGLEQMATVGYHVVAIKN